MLFDNWVITVVENHLSQAFESGFDVPDRHFNNKKLYTLSSSISIIKLLILVYSLFKNLKMTFFGIVPVFFKQIVIEL